MNSRKMCPIFAWICSYTTLPDSCIVWIDISHFLKYNLYLVCMSRWHHKLFAYFKTVNIWRMRQVIQKLKTPYWFILIWCSTEINTRQTIFHDTPSLSKLVHWSIENLAPWAPGIYRDYASSALVITKFTNKETKRY